MAYEYDKKLSKKENKINLRKYHNCDPEDTWVREYRRKDGVWVMGHQRYVRNGFNHGYGKKDKK